MSTPKKTIILAGSPVTGILLNFNQERRGGIALELILVMEKKEGRSYQRIPLSGTHYKNYVQGLPAPVAAVLRRAGDEVLIEQLVKSGFGWLRDADKPFEHLDERHYPLLRRWISEVLQELKPLAPAIKYLFYLAPTEAYHSTAIRPASMSAASPGLQFVLEKESGRLRLRVRVVINNGVYPLEDLHQWGCFLRSGNEFFLLRREDQEALERYRAGDYEAREEGMPRFMATVVRPLAERYPVNMDAVIRMEKIEEQPQGRVYVSELNENFLMIRPKWLYADEELEEDEEAETRVERDDRVLLIARMKEEEARLAEALRGLHPKFAGQSNGYYYLNFKEALEKSWFLRFYQLMQEMDVPVLGMNQLRKFKYNTNIPQMEITAGKGIDWFDLTIRVSYGELVVPLADLRKAILGKQEFILLSDGSLGMLPKEWLEKYSLLLRMGQVREGGIRLPALHWTILAEAGGGADEALQTELEEKKRRWASLETGKEWAMPAGVRAQLRDYQVAGFQWMCLLDEMGWGGCLADDMGLGKTLQTLSFLQHVVERYPEETHLVVCPTSLLYNWEGELKKFVPGLDYYLHYGADRELDEERFRRAHVIITSYGMVRNDIEHFSRRRFGYVILDESQAIKNPASQVRKAIQQLQARNRLALSGTPVQNNTFDLYAQMDFLNPGMLGGADFFRAEFAGPIDRNGDKEAAQRLRKLIYPFILRRTKEQVARDLPDKTEMILWCQMGDEQRKIYDSHKDHYRESLLERIAEEGMGKSSIYILEGLTKLRQICDSPALLRGPGGPDGASTEGQTLAVSEDRPTFDGKAYSRSWPNASVKLEELVREVTENTGDHKCLVFSQFTSMLGLIRDALSEREIPYLYLDGSVAAADRRESVEEFQREGSARVFLISLKAGGVGLTLTAADYVYLVDPWWNPAVEQQAIDRSHRIGQVKKVFAYRMICKDTVEEKILQLQERKRSLAADLVADESGFVKQLTSEDVAYLFS
ncbi:DEAD/DEAH box helicase [Puia sp.]|uniref:DEAD/DEAH box helicase n=1 Tax=Puia sp. TaxID=2045100 RepID=UPI002F423988